MQHPASESRHTCGKAAQLCGCHLSPAPLTYLIIFGCEARLSQFYVERLATPRLDDGSWGSYLYTNTFILDHHVPGLATLTKQWGLANC